MRNITVVDLRQNLANRLLFLVLLRRLFGSDDDVGIESLALLGSEQSLSAIPPDDKVVEVVLKPLAVVVHPHELAFHLGLLHPVRRSERQFGRRIRSFVPEHYLARDGAQNVEPPLPVHQLLVLSLQSLLFQTPYSVQFRNLLTEILRIVL